MTAFVQCFWVLSQIGFASIRNLTSSFGKASQPFCTEMSWANLRHFSKFSKSTIFNYFQHNKSEPNLKHDCILQCFGILFQIGFASNRNLMSSFGKVSQPFCTEFLWASLCYVLNLSQNLEPGFHIFIFQTQKMCFWAWGRFGMSNDLPICLPICKCSTNSLWSSTKVDRTYLPVNMAVALFHKHL